MSRISLTLFLFYDIIKIYERRWKMFKVKRKKDSKIFQVLATSINEVYGNTFFLVWENDGWRWRSADNYVPPNYNFEEEKGGLEE